MKDKEGKNRAEGRWDAAGSVAGRDRPDATGTGSSDDQGKTAPLLASGESRGDSSDVRPGSYRQAGVDIDAANRAVEGIRKLAAMTARPGVLGEIGGFGGLFSLGYRPWKDPILVAGTDGVGTKLQVAFLLGRHDTIGIDCVAMNVDDVVVQGAEPLFFLDYLAVGRLSSVPVAEIIRGLAEGCRQANCALIGGETAEMPGFYQDGEYDLAGFAVGAVEREEIIDGSKIQPGDQIIGLASSGLHSNGYSLARRVFFQQAGWRVSDFIADLGRTLGEELLVPTRIYARSVLGMLNRGKSPRGMAHITGGGFYENIPRILPEGRRALIRRASWEVPPVFHLLQAVGQIEEGEMFRVFNMGVGMILVVSPENLEDVLTLAEQFGEKAYHIGEIVPGARGIELAG
ncbi:MAG: phosphoribosylformylglycinamidine cyclo-ligase [Firmicutes bacterium]|nr:phosphoribosylformylglycinamidine cyclo-ligase [Bacillota bacterium]